MIDLHCHILPGIDDGPASIDESVALAAAAAGAGTRKVVATSHVSWDYPNRSGTIAGLARELRARLRIEGIGLEIATGAEIAMTVIPDTPPTELARLTLGESRCLLVEPPHNALLTGLDALVEALHASGYRVLLAHPERCQGFQRDRSMLERLVDTGVLVSVTAASFDGRFGRPVRRFALELVRDRLVHNVASDAHDDRRRPPLISAALDRAGLGPLRAWLTEDVPAAILADAPIPQRPIGGASPIVRPRWSRWLGGGSG